MKPAATRMLASRLRLRKVEVWGCAMNKKEFLIAQESFVLIFDSLMEARLVDKAVTVGALASVGFAPDESIW